MSRYWCQYLKRNGSFLAQLFFQTVRLLTVLFQRKDYVHKIVKHSARERCSDSTTGLYKVLSHGHEPRQNSSFTEIYDNHESCRKVNFLSLSFLRYIWLEVTTYGFLNFLELVKRVYLPNAREPVCKTWSKDRQTVQPLTVTCCVQPMAVAAPGRVRC